MFTLVAWYESVDPAGVLVNLAAVTDQHVFTTADDVRVPDGMPNLIGAAALINDASADEAQIESPSLRQIAVQQIQPIVAAATFGEPPEVLFHPERPIPLSPGEGLRFLVQSDPVAPAVHYGLAWLADGAQAPVGGPFYTVRAVGQNVGAAGTWTLSTVTFDQTLPVGTFQIIGFRCVAATAVAARLVFPGGIWRPGVPVVNAITDEDPRLFRFGRSGVLGEFHTNQPPQVEVLGAAGGVPEFFFDLTRVG